MNPFPLRDRSLLRAKELGYPRPPLHFPRLAPRPPRWEQTVIERALILHVIINCAYKMPIPLARAWLEREGLTGGLTAGERRYLDAVEGGLAPDAEGHQLQVEALWALAWCLSQVPELDFGSYCGDDLAGLLPNLREDEGSARFRQKSRRRSPVEFLEAFDLVYCLSWGVAQANLTRAPVPGKVQQYVIWERRRVFEWLLHRDDWDKPNFAT